MSSRASAFNNGELVPSSSAYTLAGKVLFHTIRPLIDVACPAHQRKRARGLILSLDDEVLLVKNWLGPQLWALPGGGVHKGEQPEVALRRELMEELGIALDAESYPYLGEFQSNATPFSALCYHITLANKCIPRVATRELIGAQWFATERLPVQDCDPTVTQALAVAR